MLYWEPNEDKTFVPDEDCPTLEYMSADLTYTLATAAVT